MSEPADVEKRSERRPLAPLLVSILALLASAASAAFSYRSSMISSRALDVTEADQRRQERAYLSVEDEQLVRFVSGHSLKWVLAVKNMGRTPAFNVQSVYLHSTGSDQPLRRLANAMAHLPPDTNAGSINERITKSVTGPVLAQDEYRAIFEGRRELLFLVGVRYRDVFNQPHEVRFCGVARRLLTGEFQQGRCRTGNGIT